MVAAAAADADARDLWRHLSQLEGLTDRSLMAAEPLEEGSDTAAAAAAAAADEDVDDDNAAD